MRAVPSFRRGLVYILLAACSWGTTGLTSRVLRDLSGVDAISTGFLRVLIASPALRRVYLAHLSTECNEPHLAMKAMREGLARAAAATAEVQLTFPDRATDVWQLE